MVDKEGKMRELRTLLPRCRVELHLAPKGVIEVPAREEFGAFRVRGSGKGDDVLLVFDESEGWCVPMGLDAHSWERSAEDIARIIVMAFEVAAEDMALRIKMAFEEVGVKEVKDGIQSRG